MILNGANNNVILFKIPPGKMFFFYVNPPRGGLSAAVQGHLAGQHREN